MSPAQSWSVSPQKILYSYCILLYVNKHFIFLYIIILVYDPHEGCDLVIITTSHPRGEGVYRKPGIEDEGLFTKLPLAISTSF